MDKEKAKNRALIAFAVTVFLIGAVWAVYSYATMPDYKIIYDGEYQRNILICENEWHYEDLDFLPCVINGTFGGLFQQTINFSISPQENCQSWGGNFTGFNIYNESRNKEIYDSLLPRCWTFNERDATDEWVEENCDCKLNQTICERWDCGNNLEVERR